MRPLSHLVLFFLLTLIRFSLVPLLPINLIPLIFWLTPPRPGLVWQLVLFGLINDIFAFPPQFGLTAFAFTLLLLFVHLIYSASLKPLAAFFVSALALAFISQLSSPSSLFSLPALLSAFLCLCPFALLARIKYPPSSFAISQKF